jgi:hypothetical protein
MSIRKEVNNEKLKFLYSKEKKEFIRFCKTKKENYEYGTYKTISLQRLLYRLLLS